MADIVNASEIEVIKGSELPEATNPEGMTFLGYDENSNPGESKRISFSNMTPLFGVTSDEGQSETLAGSQKMVSSKINISDQTFKGILSYSSEESYIVKCIRHIKVWIASTLSSKDIVLAVAGIYENNVHFQWYNKTDGSAIGNYILAVNGVQPTGIKRYTSLATSGSGAIDIVFDWGAYTNKIQSASSTIYIEKNYINDNSYLATFSLNSADILNAMKGKKDVSIQSVTDLDKITQSIGVYGVFGVTLPSADAIFGQRFTFIHVPQNSDAWYVYQHIITSHSTGIKHFERRGWTSGTDNVFTAWKDVTFQTLSDSVNASIAKIASYSNETNIGKFIQGNQTFNNIYKGISTNNVQADKDGIIKRLYVDANITRTMRFGIGILDQRNWAIIRKTFDIDLKAGVNDLDISNLGLLILEGETLFQYYNYFEYQNARYKQYAQGEDNSIQMYYSDDPSAALHTLNSTYGAYLAVGFSVADIQTPFALRDALENTDSTANEAKSIATDALARVGTAKDRQGNNYKLIVIGNDVIPISMIYGRVLIIGNSIMEHNASTALGWYAQRGMAATIQENDFVHLLEKGLKVKDSSATVTPVNVAAWERDFSFNLSTLLDSYLTSDIDAIVFRIGENVADADNYQAAFKDLVQYCINKCPNAEPYVAGMVWSNSAKETAMINVASELGITFINVQASDTKFRQKMGFYYKGDDNVLYPITNTGVAGHTNDHGMYVISDQILKAMSYSNPTGLYDITVTSSIAYTAFDKGVENGIISIQTTGTPIVKDTAENVIPVTNHADGVFTFVMPSSNVAVAIS